MQATAAQNSSSVTFVGEMVYSFAHPCSRMKKSNVTLLSPRVEIYVAVDSLNSREIVVAYDIRGDREGNVVTKNFSC